MSCCTANVKIQKVKSQYHHSSVYDTSMIGGDHICVYRSNDQRVCDHRQICHHHHVASERCNHDVCEIAGVCFADDASLVEIVVSLSEVVQLLRGYDFDVSRRFSCVLLLDSSL